VSKKQISTILFSFIVTTCLLITASGHTSQLQVVNILNVLTYDTPPLSYEENRQIAGLGTKIVEAVLNEAKVKHFITVYPFDESYAKISGKENSMMYPLAKTLEKEMEFNWVGPIADNSIYLFQLQNRKKIEIMSLNNINDFKIGVIENSPTHKFLIKKNITRNLILANNHDSNLQKLYNKQIDLIAGNELKLIHEIKKLKLNSNDLSRIFELIKNSGYYLAFNKFSSKVLIDKIRAAFYRLQNKGEIRAIKNSFFEK
jgi:polar amino acid transport system substrate-binding protein